jgi:hypothetical protein
MNFDPLAYGPQVAEILALDGGGHRLMPPASGTCSSRQAHQRLSNASATGLFAGATAPEAALAGLWLYFSCLDESHGVSQNVSSKEGSFWHGILHRQEPDAGNSAYWFRRVGAHPLFPALRDEAEAVASRFPGADFRLGSRWDPFAFIEFCERAAAKPGSEAHTCALEIQRAEWQLLFDYCARPKSE